MKIATIGTGMIVQRFMDACTKVKDVELTHMYSRSKETALPLAKEFNIPNIFSDLDEMLKEDFDVLYVASPNSLHFPQTKKGLLAGKHVICEKPFVATATELDELVTLAKEKKLLLFEAITTITMPNFFAIKKNLEVIGKLRLAEINFTQYSSRYDLLREGTVTNAFDPNFQGGALADIGIYNLHFMVGLFGKPLTSRYYPNLHKNGIDTSGVAIFTYPDFRVSALIAKDCTGATGVRILGEDGSIDVEGTPSICNTFRVVSKQDTITPAIMQSENKMVYEVEIFYKMWKELNFQEADLYLKHSRDVLEVFEDCKASY